jgi:hypothetical protein
MKFKQICINYIYILFKNSLFFLVSICSSSFFSFVSRYFMSLSFFSAWHNFLLFISLNLIFYWNFCFDFLYKSFGRFKSWDVFLPVLAALVLIIKEPKPLRYTLSPLYIEVLTSCMKASITFWVSFFSTPNLFEMVFTNSAFVISFFVYIFGVQI